jgi:hypothetical protein
MKGSAGKEKHRFLFSRILQDSMASTYEDEGPVPWYRTEQAIFYIVFFIVFPFFFVNIFVALIIVTFNELGEAELEDDMDKNQKSCIDFAIQASLTCNFRYFCSVIQIIVTFTEKYVWYRFC